MSDTTSRAFDLQRPPGAALPIVVDSPHSGTRWCGAAPIVAPQRLHNAEDCFVDRLYAHAPQHGAVLLAANFSRACIDPNRALDDMDEALLDAPWPGRCRPSEKTRLGIGLVWRLLNGEPLYHARLTVDDVQRRIAECWQPYHDALRAELDLALTRFGARWHLDVHSMPDDSYLQLGLPERPLADFVLGNRDGRTADEATMGVIERSLRASGFSVARNDPVQGGRDRAHVG